MTTRDSVDNVGIAPVTETFEIDAVTITYDKTEVNGSAQVGLAVKFSGNDTVELVGDGEGVEGKLLKVESDGKCTVQTGGVVTLPGGSGATLTLGNSIVGDLGPSSAEGYIRAVNSAVTAELAVANGRIQNAATSTAVVVKL